MRIILICFVCVLLGFNMQAQQEAQFTQFMFNKLSFNPAYAGSAEYASLSALHRSQWVGLEGAPTSQVLNFHTALKNKRVGLGMTVLHDQIGPSTSWSYQLKYSYGFPLANGRLAIGLQGSLRNYRVNWGMTKAIQEGDAILATEPTNRMLPNFGMGLYFQNQRFYVGASLPNMLSGDISFYDGTENSTDYSQEQQHFYLMGGLILPVGQTTKFKPAVLVKYTKHAPISIDLNASFIFFEKFWVGGTYRMGGDQFTNLGESLDAIVQYQVTQNIRAGIAYDFTLSKMRDYNSGTYEVVLDYYFINKDAVMTNPRFF